LKFCDDLVENASPVCQAIRIGPAGNPRFVAISMAVRIFSFSRSHLMLLMAKGREVAAKDHIVQMICCEGNGTIQPYKAVSGCLQPGTSNHIKKFHSICNRNPIFLAFRKSCSMITTVRGSRSCDRCSENSPANPEIFLVQQNTDAQSGMWSAALVFSKVRAGTLD
jgi:hypothetical protein